MTIRQGSSRRSPPEADDEGSLFAILEVVDYEFKAKEKKAKTKKGRTSQSRRLLTHFTEQFDFPSGYGMPCPFCFVRNQSSSGIFILFAIAR